MRYTKAKLIHSPGASPAERAFTSVPTLQDVFEPHGARTLACVCSTLKFVVDDPALWRQYLAQELNQHRWAVQYPVDKQALREADTTAKPYKEIYRGFRIIDAEYGPSVLQVQRDAGQQKAVERAQTFININFKGLRDGINTRHFLYAPQNLFADELGKRAINACVLASVYGAISWYTSVLALRGACATPESVAPFHGVQAVNTGTFVGTKTVLTIVSGGVSLLNGVAAAVQVVIGVCSALTFYQSYYVNRSAHERWLAAAEIKVHLLKFRTRIAMERARIKNPNANLNDIRRDGISEQQTKPRDWHARQSI